MNKEETLGIISLSIFVVILIITALYFLIKASLACREWGRLLNYEN